MTEKKLTYDITWKIESIAAVAVAAVRLQIAEFCELAQIALGRSGSETKMTDDGFGGEFVFIGHVFKNTDQFLGQSGLYRPFIDHFLL